MRRATGVGMGSLSALEGDFKQRVDKRRSRGESPWAVGAAKPRSEGSARGPEGATLEAIS